MTWGEEFQESNRDVRVRALLREVWGKGRMLQPCRRRRVVPDIQDGDRPIKAGAENVRRSRDCASVAVLE